MMSRLSRSQAKCYSRVQNLFAQRLPWDQPGVWGLREKAVTPPPKHTPHRVGVGGSHSISYFPGIRRGLVQS